MFKKFLIVLLSLFITSCSKNKLEFIDPVRDVFLFDELDEKVKNDWLNVDTSSSISNYQLQMLNKSIYEFDLKDINGNIINLTEFDKVVINIVSIDCPHCINEIQNYLYDYLDNEDIKYVQYFNETDKQAVIDFYKSNNVDIPDNLTIILKDDLFYEYIKNDLNISKLPFFCFYNSKKLVFNHMGELDKNSYLKALEFSYSLYPNGIDIVDTSRSVEDVKNDISLSNQQLISKFDNNEFAYSSKLTYQLLGKKVNFDDVINKDSKYLSDINDYDYYKDKKLVILYETLQSLDDEYKVNFINELVSLNNDFEYIVVLCDGFTSSSEIYSKMNSKFNCKCVSILGYLPIDFMKFKIYEYPCAVYVYDSTFVGAYCGIQDVSLFNESLDTFLGSKCIGLKANN